MSEQPKTCAPCRGGHHVACFGCACVHAAERAFVATTIGRDAHDTNRRCHCVAEHRPAPLELERHHVWPLYLGGPEDDWNVEWVCPNAHTNAHELLREMMRQDRSVPHSEFVNGYEQPVSRWAHELARVGFLRWQSNLTGVLLPQLVRLHRQVDPESPLPQGGALYAAEAPE